MKKLILLTVLVFTYYASAATCNNSTISRTNNAANAVLTSTKYNADHNTAYTQINSLAAVFDGGCITDGSLEQVALDLTEAGWDNITKSGIQGCEVTRTDANTMSIAACYLSVAGNWVKTTIATTVTWGCTGCSAESSSTVYYVSVKSTSTGTTLTPLITTDAPTSRGYDTNGHRVLAKFYNNASSNINKIFLLDQEGDFSKGVTANTDVAGMGSILTTTAGGTPAWVASVEIGDWVTSYTYSASAQHYVYYDNDVVEESNMACVCSNDNTYGFCTPTILTASDRIQINTHSTAGAGVDTNFSLMCMWKTAL